jgi:uncharacterized protein (DUF1697 family)
MADFRRLLADLGYARVETYIQSGNAVVDVKGQASRVARDVAAALERHMGAPVGVVARTHEQMQRVLVRNPFAAEAAADGARVHACFLAAVPLAGAQKALEQIVEKSPQRRDRFHLDGDTLYLHLPDGAAETKFTAKALSRALGCAVTARNWNTVVKLAAMAAR